MGPTRNTSFGGMIMVEASTLQAAAQAIWNACIESNSWSVPCFTLSLSIYIFCGESPVIRV